MQITAEFIQPLPSSTVLVLREERGYPEVLMVLRKKNTSFGASYVFPGGLVEKSDTKEEEELNPQEKELFNKRMDIDKGGFAYYSAAIRELFEEAGILLCKYKNGNYPDIIDLDRYRDDLNSGVLDWNRFLRDHHLYMDIDNLIYFSYWITPLMLSKRFTTRFFISRLPLNQIPSHCGDEVIDSRWINPRSALIARRRKEINIPHPTAITLMQIREFETIDEILEWASKISDEGVPCYFPQLTASELRGDSPLE